jgi:hypothetical protein
VEVAGLGWGWSVVVVLSGEDGHDSSGRGGDGGHCGCRGGAVGGCRDEGRWRGRRHWEEEDEVLGGIALPESGTRTP